jgi:hypothetical protein
MRYVLMAIAGVDDMPNLEGHAGHQVFAGLPAVSHVTAADVSQLIRHRWHGSFVDTVNDELEKAR